MVPCRLRRGAGDVRRGALCGGSTGGCRRGSESSRGGPAVRHRPSHGEEDADLLGATGLPPDEARWGETGTPSYCPMCGGTEKLRPIACRKPLPYWCGECRRHFSVKTGTVMHRSHIGFQKWAIATYLWSVSLKGVSSMRLHRDLKITQKSAYFMAQRLREAWTEGQDRHVAYGRRHHRSQLQRQVGDVAYSGYHHDPQHRRPVRRVAEDRRHHRP